MNFLFCFEKHPFFCFNLCVCVFGILKIILFFQSFSMLSYLCILSFFFLISHFQFGIFFNSFGSSTPHMHSVNRWPDFHPNTLMLFVNDVDVFDNWIWTFKKRLLFCSSFFFVSHILSCQWMNEWMNHKPESLYNREDLGKRDDWNLCRIRCFNQCFRPFTETFFTKKKRKKNLKNLNDSIKNRKMEIKKCQSINQTEKTKWLNCKCQQQQQQQQGFFSQPNEKERLIIQQLKKIVQMMMIMIIMIMIRYWNK